MNPEVEKVLYILLVSWLYLLSVHARVTVNLYSLPTNTGILGQGGVELRCSYSTTNNVAAVNTIYIQAKVNSEMDFKNIATFYPYFYNFNATLSNTGLSYLENRVTLTNPTEESKTAILTFDRVDWPDETEYRCQVLWIPNPNNDIAISSTVYIIVKDVHATVSVDLVTSPTNTAILGQGGVELRCSYSTTYNEDVNTINIQAKFNGQFINIASFYPVAFNFNASVSDDASYLQSRVTLTNPTTESKTAILTFDKIDCPDETEYRCRMFLATNPYIIEAISPSVNITVKGPPKQPDSIPIYTPRAGIEEGQTITFTCTGNLGKPHGRFRWVRIRGVQQTTYDSETTLAVTMPGTCTFNGSSSFSLRMGPEDNGVAVRCIVVYENIVQTMLYQTTPQIEVFYKVRNVVVSKPSGAPQVFVEGSDPVTLSCSAEGNPASTTADFTWYKEPYQNTLIGTGRTYTIYDVVSNKSGVYVCIVQNTYNGKVFTANGRTDVKIGTEPCEHDEVQ